ncbi:hypothetical protein GUITHDRAFT_109087 [Guillardia theta CCMP2712]|uniref:Uncharacterized protein n=1 Tax=Guillardia theta (strain CCMP2712) TaxID=905079 RepID=L1JAB9_GUITC|nr:hypothetical protein GUITHDRAFT_109087 [Guillardia theta CCMP2712]EKX45044.1 hypothetical protein GUITHDRAFT_109087 [Guillardia theta CCMP2712]|eukprot:XP_005832024.1 hypothetical protein GUITHDRAFT_109087 [Guillardia theta CCMP2712]
MDRNYSRRPNHERERPFSDSRGRGGRDSSWRGGESGGGGSNTPNIVRAYHEGNVEYRSSQPSAGSDRNQPDMKNVGVRVSARQDGLILGMGQGPRVSRAQTSERSQEVVSDEDDSKVLQDAGLNISLFDNCTEFEAQMLRNQIEYLKKVGKEETFHRGRFRRYCWDIDDWMEEWIERPQQYVATDKKSLDALKKEAQNFFSEVQVFWSRKRVDADPNVYDSEQAE